MPRPLLRLPPSATNHIACAARPDHERSVLLDRHAHRRGASTPPHVPEDRSHPGRSTPSISSSPSRPHHHQPRDKAWEASGSVGAVSRRHMRRQEE
ncbi:hypothetical protein E2562_010330 [Oryza meyeriana var. granulata]|uniref:Uncharacterized protein n=1 Tax=Oryza meyeriana var. granulata TaxID=110450 RepID=A0A6G1F6E9_9ORYZ|nr:hypothetical protein E2562_010330 [Oryza meyeriana var. granulata]